MRRLLLILALLLPCGAARADAPSVDPWAATVEAYGFLPWVQSTTTVRGFDAQSDLAPGQLLNLLQSIVSVRGSVERDRLGALVDVAYTQLGAESSRNTARGLLTGRSEVTSTTGVYDVAVRYRFGDRPRAVGQPGDWWLIPYAGVRLLQARLDVDAQLQGNGPFGLQFSRQGSLDRTWAQPLIGSQASIFVSPGLRLFAQADAAGFGLAGDQDLSGNARIGVGYALGTNTNLMSPGDIRAFAGAMGQSGPPASAAA
ncbi:MAG: hypothetical protein ACKOE9_05960 [Vulcanococcus sp.]